MPSTADAPIRRVYIEKLPGFDVEARRLQADLAEFLGISLAGLRILHRYDAAHLDRSQFEAATRLVFSEPQCDRIHRTSAVPAAAGESFFAVEYLPGQFDQRADSAEQCVELAVGTRPLVRTARVFVVAGPNGPVPDATLEAIKKYLINPVDSREAGAALPETLESDAMEAAPVPILSGFSAADADRLRDLATEYGLAMSAADLAFCRDHFAALRRDPSLAELRVLDTYWSDHCRHTTFTTELAEISVADGPDAGALRAALDLYEATRREVYGEDGARTRPRTLMDLAVIGARALKKRGLLEDLEESAEINACSIRVNAEFAPLGTDGAAGTAAAEPWLLMFKNETHNHPTEIEPFGGAATCLGGAIRDPLSGRAYVHQALRVSGGGDPRAPLPTTLPGKLPQVKIAREAAAGYASYGNQIGLATGQVAEFYHPGFLAKRLELGAVVGAVPAAWVRREEPAAGDLVLLVGGKTGRDGVGGATGSSKAHSGESVAKAGAEVQKGNAVEERKIQRLFRDPGVSALIKRCNDFGAGGVAVAVGELAPGLAIDLDAVPRKYSGLDGIELAVSESQERMAVVCAAADAEALIRAAAAENLDATVIARVGSGSGREDGAAIPPRLRMSWRGAAIVDLDRAFLDSNGAARSATARVVPGLAEAAAAATVPASADATNLAGLPASVLLDRLERELRSLRSGSRRGLQERFDGSIGAASVLYPWGGADQGTPECGLAALLPDRDRESRTASLMSFGYDPDLALRSPYRAAKGAVREALAKFACLGGDPWSARLSLQEYFGRADTPEAWGQPLAALLGALEAQLALGTAAVGGKDSMSGTYRDPVNHVDLAVPPTLVAFAAGVAPAAAVRSGALCGDAGNPIVLLYPAAAGPEGEWDAFRANLNALKALGARSLVRAAYPVAVGGVASTLALMAFGNTVGVEADAAACALVGDETRQGSVMVELDASAFAAGAGEAEAILAEASAWTIAARTLAAPLFRLINDDGDLRSLRDDEAPDQRTAETPLAVLRRAYEYPLIRVYPQTSGGATVVEAPEDADALDLPRWRRVSEPAAATRVRRRATATSGAKPLVVLPVFPGTNCEWDLERAFRRAGARTKIVVFRNRDRADVRASVAELAAAVDEAQILALSGGFSAGDEPEGSGKFIANALRAARVHTSVTKLMDKRDGLVLGVCNGFQALIKLGLVPYGEYREADETQPTLTYNAIGRHVSRMVRTTVMSDRSPWLALDGVGVVHTLPVSHGEGRIALRDDLARDLFAAGQVPFCYVDAAGRPTRGEPDNPNGSAWAIEGLTSPDGRILGKMAHSERCGDYVHVNIPGNKCQRIFEAGVGYFR